MSEVCHPAGEDTFDLQKAMAEPALRFEGALKASLVPIWGTDQARAKVRGSGTLLQFDVTERYWLLPNSGRDQIAANITPA
jgi:hypothetical protein